MKKTIKAALKGITTATAGFLKKRGIYVVALALISAAALSAVLTVKQPNGADPAQTDAPASEVNTDIGDRLTDAQLPIATPTPSPTATPTPMPDFTPAPPTPKPTAVQKLSPPVRGEVIWGFAVNELIYSPSPYYVSCKASDNYFRRSLHLYSKPQRDRHPFLLVPKFYLCLHHAQEHREDSY